MALTINLDPALNACNNCRKTAGKYINPVTGNPMGIYLYQDERGFKICNICKDRGFLIPRKKIDKLEKKRLAKMKRDMGRVLDIKHITLDSKGETV